MRMLWLGLPLLMATAQTAAQPPQSLDELLRSVLKERSEDKQQNDERLQRFTSEKDQQQARLAEAKAKLAAEEARGQALRGGYEASEKELAAQREALHAASGELNELQGVVRQIAADVKGLLAGSLVSAQIADRSRLADQLAQSSEVPAIEDIEKLWQLLLQEAVESGKIVRFPAKVITADGKDEQREVTRIGVFNASSDGRFLRYAPDIQRLVEPPRQPAALYQRMAKTLEHATSGVTPVAFDPTRGAMLTILAQEPTLLERIRQGRLVGWLTLGLGVVAMIIAAQRYLLLTLLRRRVKRQLQQPAADVNNPLGRVMKVYSDNPAVDTETLQLKLDEAVLREIPSIQRGLGTLVIIAEASPLLGLLGTVSGMIATFQALTMFGAGDAKVVAGGISEALVTTVIGLCVAIPTLLVHSVIKGKSDYLIQVLDEQSAGMIAEYAEAHPQQAATVHAIPTRVQQS